MLTKRIATILALLLIITTTRSQAQQTQEISTMTPVFRKTERLAEAIEKGKSFQTRITRNENGLVGVNKKTATVHPYNEVSAPIADPALQPPSTSLVTAATATIGVNVSALPYTFLNPADPVNATGPNHTIQMINNSTSSLIRILDKTGIQVIPDFTLTSLTGVQGAGDPIVQYDQLAGRWLLNEFGYSGGVTSYVNTLIFAISATDDPLGAWYIYSFQDLTFFVDYQKIAIWHNAYYATSNDFNTAGNAYLGSSIYAFNRTKMLAGDPTANAIRSRLNDVTGRYFSMAPVNQEGPTSSSLSGLFAFYQNDAWTAAADADSIYVFEFTPNFVTPASSTIGVPTQLLVSPLDDDLCAASREACINQQGGASVEALTERLMNKINYRRFPTYESMLINATVDANGAGRAGIRWWELRRSGGAWSIFQEGTYSPDALHRFMGSMSQDARGNIALIYNTSSSTSFPSIRFTARNPCDPVGTMTLAEQTIIAGTAANGSTRYGDYNSLSIDPSDNLTFWLTGMYNVASQWSTRVASFTLNDCAPTPKVRFQSSALALREKDQNVTSGCLNYKDYTVNVVIDAAPSADAILTFNNSGTATSGQDYTVTPSSVTLNGANMTRTVTIRVFDDAAFEGNETFTLGYTLNNSGGNATAADYNQTCVVNIVDNDPLPVVSNTIIQTWGSANLATTTSGPFNGNGFTDKRIQNLYYSSDMIAAGLAAGNITHLAWNLNAATVTTFNNMTVSIGFVSNAITNLGTGFQAPTFTTVYSGNFTTPGTTGWYTFTLPTPVAWNGTDNMIVQTCWDNAAATTDVAVIGTTVAYNATAFVRQNGAGNLCATAATNISTGRPDLRLTVSVPVNPVANTVISKVVNLGPNDDVPVYDATGRVLMRIKNNTAWDYGCTTVQIDRAGNGTTTFWNPSVANNVTTKTFRVTPTNANASGNYDITLYYTAAEKAGYEAATGQFWSTVQMVKTGGAISSITPATPSATPVFINSVLTHGTFGTDYTVKATFNNGFSGYAVGKPGNVLPVSLLFFKGQKNNDVINLDWRTSYEYNNNRFEVETSKDANNFYQIGSVASKGNATFDQNYAFTDNLPAPGTNYYRLKQVDIDSRFTYSQVIAIEFDKKGRVITVYPNPAKDKLTIGFASPTTNVTIRVIGTDGKVVRTEKAGNVQRNYDLAIQSLTPGAYVLEVVEHGKKHTIKFVKE